MNPLLFLLLLWIPGSSFVLLGIYGYRWWRQRQRQKRQRLAATTKPTPELDRLIGALSIHEVPGKPLQIESLEATMKAITFRWPRYATWKDRVRRFFFPKAVYRNGESVYRDIEFDRSKPLPKLGLSKD